MGVFLFITWLVFLFMVFVWLQSYYNVYGGATAQYPMYGTGPGGIMNGAAAAAAAFYPYFQFGEGSGGGGGNGFTAGSGQQGGYGVQYPHHLFQYSAAINSSATSFPQHYAAPPMSLPPTPPTLPSGNLCKSFNFVPFRVTAFQLYTLFKLHDMILSRFSRRIKNAFGPRWSNDLVMILSNWCHVCVVSKTFQF